MNDGISSVMLTEEQIASRIHELGIQISNDYKGKDLLLLGMLKGAFIFLADLARCITIPLSIDFIAISSYRESTESTGEVKITKRLDSDVTDKHVLIVEDIIDTGYTLSVSNLIDDLYKSNAASVKICTLLDKPERRKIDIKTDYTGFTIPNEFVVGYGLDFDSKYRNLPFIGILDSLILE